MQLSDERIQEMKNLLEKEHGREFSWKEASDAAYNLAGLAELCLDSWQEDQRRKKKLEENPKGFILDGVGYSCFICGSGTQKDENWYDKWGIKCLICQDAINRKEIPPSLAKYKDSWYTKYDLERAFKLKGKVLNSWIKGGILKARVITNRGKGTHYTLFLIRDNKGFLPPKDMVKGHMVKEERGDDKNWYTMHPWYHFVDPWEHLKDYKIMNYMRFPEENPEEKDFFDSLNLSLSENNFDSRDPILKRKEFNNKRNKLLKELVKERGAKCQLRLLEQCGKDLVVDHMIPLSSNILNKDIHKVKAEKGKKVKAQSFGSNHKDNLLIACEKCNNHKKHRFIMKTKEGKFKIV
ncbi:MAG: HNH endonuclease [Candidatus Moranbacteria bacterium]|nr:HNH endonuclease [Candidatus Moranbacteria bacterium]